MLFNSYKKKKTWKPIIKAKKAAKIVIKNK